MSSSVFGNYAHYYNLLYKEKDYAAEAHYVHELIQRYCPETKAILDLGCGTGSHDFELAALGYEVTGIDMSEEMLSAATARLAASLAKASPLLSFEKGDIRTVRLDKKFDVVVSLFHVMSYQTTNNDFLAALTTAREHLVPGGYFIFDCWYGPAVLSDPPGLRVKRFEDDQIECLRIAEPVMHPNENVVDVNYQVMITDKKTAITEQLRETHCMRYLFAPEIELFLRIAGFQLVDVSEWMTGRSPAFSSWGACFVVKR